MVPTPIPKSIVQWWRTFWSGALADILWKTFVVAVVGAILYVTVQIQPGFFVLFVVGTILSVTLSDNIRAVISDIWHRNFWVWRP